MVDQIFSSIHTVLSSLCDCFSNGNFDIHRYWTCKSRKRRKVSNYFILDSVAKNARKRTNVEIESKATKNRTPRSVKRHKLSCRYNNGD